MTWQDLTFHGKKIQNNLQLLRINRDHITENNLRTLLFSLPYNLSFCDQTASVVSSNTETQNKMTW